MQVGGQTSFSQIYSQFNTPQGGSGADKHIRGDAQGTKLYNHSSFSISGFGADAAQARQAKWSAGAETIRVAIDREFGPGVGDQVFQKIGREGGPDLGQGVRRGDMGAIRGAIQELTGRDITQPQQARAQGTGGGGELAPLKRQLNENQQLQARVFTGGTPGTVDRPGTTDQVLTAMFGKRLSDAEIRGLAGAPESCSFSLNLVESDPRVLPNADRQERAVLLTMTRRGDEEGAFKTLQVTAYRDRDGQVNLYHDWVKTSAELRDESDPPGNLGGAFLVKQVDTARALGVHAIHNFAAGDKAHSNSYNGYYTWPRYGGNAPLTAEIADRLQSRADYTRFRSALERAPHPLGNLANKPDLTLQDLMATQQGRDFWREHGFGLPVTFDLDPGSQTMQTFQSYTVPSACFELRG